MFINVHVSLYSLSRGSICNFGIKQVYQIRHHDQTCKTVTTFIKSTIKYDKTYISLMSYTQLFRVSWTSWNSWNLADSESCNSCHGVATWERTTGFQGNQDIGHVPIVPHQKRWVWQKQQRSRIHGEELRLSENLHGHIRYVAKPQDFTSNHAEIC